MASRVVIAGGGFGGFHVAQTLERLLPASRSSHVTLVNDENYSLYTPFMAGVAGGALEPRHIVIPLREALPRTDVRVVRVEGGDPSRNALIVRNQAGKREDLIYDQLVVALGSVTRTAPVPGLVEHAMGFKTLAEAVAVRDRLLRTLEMAETLEDSHERAAYLTFVWVGGGYAGLGGLAEVQEFARDITRLYPRCRAQGLRFVLVEARERIMGEVPDELAEFALGELRERGIEIRSATTVTELAEDRVTLSTGESIATRMVVWTAGVMPAPVVADLGLPRDPTGRLRVDSHMRVDGHSNVWALGDAAAVPDPTKADGACPPTRQHAMRQAWVAGVNVAAALGVGSARPFTYKTRGVFVDLGRLKAVALFMGLRLSGRSAWLLTRWYHLKRVPGWGRRFQLATDWANDRMFARDVSQLGQPSHRLDRPGHPDST
ncbi:MAG: NAD(P)/FAD-dependent oxidoreductase [Thermoleophilaceae bacterium]